ANALRRTHRLIAKLRIAHTRAFHRKQQLHRHAVSNKPMVRQHRRSVRGSVGQCAGKAGRKKRMKEPHIEGVAIHDDPESCAGACEGDSEALTGAPAGWVLSREIRTTRVPTPLTKAEGNMHASEDASSCATLRGQRPHARRESFCSG